MSRRPVMTLTNAGVGRAAALSLGQGLTRKSGTPPAAFGVLTVSRSGL